MMRKPVLILFVALILLLAAGCTPAANGEEPAGQPEPAGDCTQHILGGVLMDLTELVQPFADRFAPGMLDKYTIGDHVWAVPLSDSSTSTFFYNADLFEELGLQEPQTYAELVSISETIRNEKGILPLIHQGGEPWYWPMWFFETFAQTSGNNSIQYTEDFLMGSGSAACGQPILRNRHL